MKQNTRFIWHITFEAKPRRSLPIKAKPCNFSLDSLTYKHHDEKILAHYLRAARRGRSLVPSERYFHGPNSWRHFSNGHRDNKDCRDCRNLPDLKAPRPCPG